MRRTATWTASFLLLAGVACSPSTDSPPEHGAAPDDDDVVAEDDDGGDDDATPGDDDDDDSATAETSVFPDYITANEDYFITRIGAVPYLEEADYQLSITGLVDQAVELSLDELRMLPASSVLNTLECIGNPSNGGLFGTALWEGFSLYDLLDSQGIREGATHARFECADGYWTSVSLDQLQGEGVIGALQMNGEELPADQGFPLRVVLPGYYGVKHPAWVTGIELISTPIEDYWETSGWDCSPSMPVDSKFFFPASGTEVAAGVPFEVGGAAFGGTRVDRVEVTTDGGTSWIDAEVVRQDDLDHVWMFWQATVTLETAGQHTIHARATDMHGAAQLADDTDGWNGTEDWPQVLIHAVD